MVKFTDRYFIESTSKTPKIDLDKNTGEFKIIGRSLPEDAKEFYKPILKWIDFYFQLPNVTTIVNFDLEYLNSSSSKMILDILYKLKKSIDSGLNIIINWEYDKNDEEMMNTGKDFADLVGIPINLKNIDYN